MTDDEILGAVLGVAREPAMGETTKLVSLRVPADVLAAYKAGGRFYQTRMIEVLRRGLDEDNR
jgi:uncharacterized protein (DUF4415 family)